MELKELNEYDWSEAFVFADGFTTADVAHIEAASEGANDDDPWVIYGTLKDGQWFYLSAGCDYTGWDCQASGESKLGSSKSEMERMHLTQYDRRRLGVGDAGGALISAEEKP